MDSIPIGYSVAFGVLQAFTLAILSYVLKQVRDFNKDQKNFEVRVTQEHAILHEKINNVEKTASIRISKVERSSDVLHANQISVSKDISEIKSLIKDVQGNYVSFNKSISDLTADVKTIIKERWPHE